MAVHGYVRVIPTTVSQTGTSSSIGANGKVHFSSVSALNINGVFSIEYDNYLIVTQYKGSGSLSLTMQLRASGIPANTDYVFQSLIADNITLTAARSTSQTSMAVNTIAGTLTCSSILYVYRPYTTFSTGFRISSLSDVSSATQYDYSGSHGNANSTNAANLYDGFNLNTSTGSITGSLTIYGAKK